MFAPYERVILMHLVVIFGFMLGAPAVLLVFGKLAADVFSHAREHGFALMQYRVKG